MRLLMVQEKAGARGGHWHSAANLIDDCALAAIVKADDQNLDLRDGSRAARNGARDGARDGACDGA
jgi:hypothetical protein